MPIYEEDEIRVDLFRTFCRDIGLSADEVQKEASDFAHKLQEDSRVNGFEYAVLEVDCIGRVRVVEAGGLLEADLALF